MRFPNPFPNDPAGPIGDDRLAGRPSSSYAINPVVAITPHHARASWCRGPCAFDAIQGESEKIPARTSAVVPPAYSPPTK